MTHHPLNKHRSIKRIGGILFLIFTCFLIMGCSSKNAVKQGEAAEVPETAIDKNKAAIEAVLEIEFTGPDEEYLRLRENYDAKSREFWEKDPEGETYTVDPMIGTPEFMELEEYSKKTYASYFMDYAYDNFKVWAFQYHWFGKEAIYQMDAADIEVTQSDNPKTPLQYNFTVLVEYVDKEGEAMQFEISGKVICPEEGKIGKLTYTRTAQYLIDQMRNDYPEQP